MIGRSVGILATLCMAVVAGACADAPTVPDPTPAPSATPPPSAPAVSISAPAPVGPDNGGRYFGWPTLTVRNAERSNTNNALLYRFEISTREDFAAVPYSWIAQEGAEQTSYVPPAAQVPPAEGVFFWRVIAIDQANAVQSPPSAAQSFQYFINSEQNRIAEQVYGGLWGAVRPTGTRGRARLGPGWQIRVIRSFDGVVFQSPPLETLRMFDLLDLGYQPLAAIDWMRSRGYTVNADWYPGPLSIGFPFQYMANVNGGWELVVRVGG